MGHIKTVEVFPQKSECINRFKMELEDKFVGGY